MGDHFIRAIVWLLSLSSYIGGFEWKYVMRILSIRIRLKKVKAAMGKRRGRASPYMKVIQTVLAISEYL